MASVDPVWISPFESTTASPGQRPAYWLRREFEVGTQGRAILRFSARGLVEIFVNGVRVGDEMLPGYMQYDRRLPLRTIDVTEHVQAGVNAITVVLADGWFRGQTGATRASDQWGTITSFWAELDVDSTPALITDGDWRCAQSHITSADLIAGQREDRRRFDAAVYLPDFDDTAWDHVVIADEPDVPFAEYSAPPVRRVDEIRPVRLTQPRPGVHVVDFGQNINGWTRLTDLGPAGTEITLTHGEWLGPDGDVTTDHLRVDFPFLPAPLPAGQVDVVISAGRPDDVFEPRLTTHGFRYVRVEGHPAPLDADDLRGIVVHSDLPRTGWFECDNTRVQQLHEAAVWSLRDNMCEIPTDCPHRERLGWTGDWQIFAPTAAFLYDVDEFSRKWLADVRLAQRDDGVIANHAPSTPAEGFAGPTAALQGSAGWGDVIVLTPWALYEAYGESSILAESWESMERWVEYGERSARDGRSSTRAAARPDPAPHEQYLWDTGFHWGEWLEPGFVIADFGAFVVADKGEVATAYLHRSAATMARTAEVLHKPGETVARYQELAAATRDAWQREYINDDGTLVVQTQAGHVRALMFDLVPHELRPRVADRLAALVREAGTTVGTGFLSTGMLLPALAEHGHVDLAYELLLQPNEPGWMVMIDRGATTVWERWNGVDEHGVPHESLNHYSKGAVATFLHRYVAGLAPTSPGYRGFVVRPRPGGGIEHVSQRLDTPHGRIEIEWSRRGGEFELRLSVPTGTTATVELPNSEAVTVDPGEHTWSTTITDG